MKIMFLRTQSTYMPKQHVNHINTMLNRFSKCKQVTESSNAHLLLLSCVSKIMERIIFKHVYNYFHCKSLFFQYQGFLPGHSTVYQLLETYHSIVQHIDEDKLCCMVFGDLSNAFDRMWHKGLFFKFQTYGISGDLLHWFSSYLGHRSQKVMYKDQLSSQLDIF